MLNFIVVGEIRVIVAQVLLAIHSFTDANCVVICGKESRLLHLSRLCSKLVEIDFYGVDDAQFAEQVNACAMALPGVMLVPGDCQAVRLVNRVRSLLKVPVSPVPTTAVLDLMENKWSFHAFCVRSGLNVPPTRLFASKHALDFDAVAAELGLPFVVKPVDQVASYGVHVIESGPQYNRLIRDQDAYRYAPLIAQKFITGVDVGLNLLALDGKVAAIAIQQQTGAVVRFFPNRYLEDVAHVIAGAAGYHGIMNVDARIETGSGRIFLFESNPRVWRSLYASVWCGLNFLEEGIHRRPPGHGVTRLTSGKSDVYYHPAFRPSQWPILLLDKTRKGRMLRIMMSDPYTFSSSIRPLLTTFWQRANWILLRRRVQRIY